jgi:hypothetical protein
MSTEPNKCVRCRQPLPEGSGFCVSCGHNNEAALIERRVKVVGQADARIGWARRMTDFLRGLGGIFRWR